MKVCRVLGNVVASAHHPAYDSQTVLLVSPESFDSKTGDSNTGESKKAAPAFLALDRVQAGAGDRVLVLTEGNGVRQIMGDDAGPIRSLVVGIIDDIQIQTAQ
ncbi:hypothetical protein KAI87_05455 [Myxococcota bacterium]|nr:hypothetical protein [Myxococcota bacterium]